MADQQQIGIIGAGMGGLAAAYDLVKAGHRVTIYEAAPEVGGLAAGFKAPHWDWTLEKYYHHWFASDQHILELIRELGWSDRVIFPRPYTVIYWNGEFHPFDSIFTTIPLFLLRHFSLPDVIRYGVAGLYLRFFARWEPLEKVTADAWTRRWFGPRVHELQWRPLLVSKFGEENAQIVNMAWLWARLRARTTRLGTFVGGFQTFLDQLAERLRTQGVTIRLSTPVTAIHPQSSAQKGQEAGGQARRLRIATAAGSESYDAVIATSSPALMARLAPDLPASYSESLRALKSMGAVALIIALTRPLTRYYWHNLPKDAGFPFLAMVEHTNFVPAEHFGGDHIIYCGDYLDVDHEYFKLSKEALLERFLPAMKRLNPECDRSWVKETWLWKTPYAQPVPPLNHSKNIPPIRTPVSGLYFASMSQVYPWDRGTNFAVEIGRRAARLMMEDLERIA
ncbi:MAG: NAD(P)/FAD-dependent oxidoreductase [Chloroflexi bacterium]|nr:NAD(P)/FAD-dependent oxidoreductase [Chloroflexota bacterium]